MPKRSKTESAKSKVESAVALGGLGASIGGPIGAGVGALTGLIIGDERIVFPLDMIAIPAYQAYMIEGTPSLQIYVRAGETIIPSGGNVQDVRMAMESDDAMIEGDLDARGFPNQAKKLKKKTAYQKRYMKAFKEVKSKHMKKNGTWKQDGFKRAVKEAHKKAGGKK